MFFFFHSSIGMKEEDCKRLVQSSNKKLRKKTRSQFSDQWKQMSFEDRLKAMGKQNESVAQQYVELPLFQLDSIKQKAILNLGIVEKTNKDLEEKKINIEKFEEDDNQKVEVEKKSKKSETTPLTTKQQNKLNKKKKNKAIGK